MSTEELDELIIKYTKLVGKVAHANYDDVDNDIPKLIKIREEIDRRLKYLDYILYKCGQSINKSYTINLKKAEKFLTRR